MELIISFIFLLLFIPANIFIINRIITRRTIRYLWHLSVLTVAMHYIILTFIFSVACYRNLDVITIKAFATMKNLMMSFRKRHSKVFKENLNWMIKTNNEEWKIQQENDGPLHAIFLRNEKSPNSKNVIIVVHGHRGNPWHMAHFVKFYYETLGYHVLCPIARGHGSSEGDIISFGWKEKDDLKLWAEAIKKEIGNDVNLVLHGLSMGAATVLMAAPSFPNLKAVIADCSFTNLKGVWLSTLSFIPRPISILMFEKANKRILSNHNFSFSDIDVLTFVSKIDVPLLIIHGEKDKITPYSMALSIYEESPSKNKKLLYVPYGGHGDAWFVAPIDYSNAIFEILNVDKNEIFNDDKNLLEDDK